MSDDALPAAKPRGEFDVGRPARLHPVRAGPRGRPPGRRGDRPLRAALPGARHQGGAARRAHRSRCMFTLVRAGRHWRSWSPTSGGRGRTSPAARPSTSCYTPLLGHHARLVAAVPRHRDHHLGQEADARRDVGPGAARRRRRRATSSSSPRPPSLNMVDETGRQAPAAAEGGAAAAGRRPGPGRGGAADRRAASRTRNRRTHALSAHRLEPARQRRAAGTLVREDGTPIRPEDVSVGGQMTVFPGDPGRRHQRVRRLADAADPPARRGRRDAAGEHRAAKRDQRSGADSRACGNFVAYSKICTHAGCPASLYEQQTNRLLCPCHQSQFHITDNARPIFGPATRRLPQLPIDGGRDGYFVAKSTTR